LPEPRNCDTTVSLPDRALKIFTSCRSWVVSRIGLKYDPSSKPCQSPVPDASEQRAERQTIAGRSLGAMNLGRHWRNMLINVGFFFGGEQLVHSKRNGCRPGSHYISLYCSPSEKFRHSYLSALQPRHLELFTVHHGPEHLVAHSRGDLLHNKHDTTTRLHRSRFRAIRHTP
jgi:hypothetical protein